MLGPAPAQTQPWSPEAPKPVRAARRAGRSLRRFPRGTRVGPSTPDARRKLGGVSGLSPAHTRTHVPLSLLHRGLAPSWHRPWKGARQGRGGRLEGAPGHATFPEGST